MDVFANILSLTVAFTIPLLLTAMGGMFSERSGTINIALEGIMIFGSLFGCLFLSMMGGSEFARLHSQLFVFLAILLSGGAGILFSLLLAFASINLKADQTIGGTALNMLAPAFAIVLTWAIQGTGQTSIAIPTWAKITPEMFGMATSATPGFFEKFIFSNFYLTTPIAILLFAIATVFLYKTKFGLRLRSCGEHPQAADSLGINVYKTRYEGVIISGAFAGIGGFAFTLVSGSAFSSTVAGYGFLALAVMIFGNWHPIKILGASVFFALFKVIGSSASAIPFLPSFADINKGGNLYLMLPYIVTMIVLALTSKRSRAPKAEGIPYDKGSR